MEVLSRSSWFLLVLGFALIVASSVQETTDDDCPTTDKVSCTSGKKCNEHEECELNEICCANSCYTKRCIPITKGDANGPTETDCRPYIEKALKELEIGEAGHVQDEEHQFSENDNDQIKSTEEDVPTIEITDDSSHQQLIEEEEEEEEVVTGEAENISDETVEEEIKSIEQHQETVLLESNNIIDNEDDSGETPDEKNVEKSEENHESDEETKTDDQLFKEESGEHVDMSVEEIEKAAKISVKEEEEENESIIVKRAIPEVEIPPIEAIPVQTEADTSAEMQFAKKSVKESLEEAESIEEILIIPSSVQNIEDGVGCPPSNKVSCTEGDLCTKHRQCGENKICCSNKCYRKRCTEGSVPQEEIDAESDESEESVETKNKEETVPAATETGCPPPSLVSCTEGALCSKHRQCREENTICCPNKCYRKRCTAGTATSAELAEESDEESQEENVEEVTINKPSSSSSVTPSADTNTGCPLPSAVSCVEGDICSKHRHCGQNQICCRNKCYRKRCTAGSPTEEDLASDGSSEESKEEETTTKAAAASSSVKIPSKKDSGCPERNAVSCTGEKCAKNKNCGTGEICCASKCYRKVCVPGIPSDSAEEEEEEESDEDAEEVKQKESRVEIPIVEDETGCPSADKVSCTEGVRCGENDDCNRGEICCPNKCYNRRCIPGTTKSVLDDEEESAEKLPKITAVPSKSKVAETVNVIVEPKKEFIPKPSPSVAAPSPKKEVKKQEIKIPVIQIQRVVEPVVVDLDDDSLERDGEAPVEELSIDTENPTELRPRDHVEHLLKLDKESSKLEKVQNKVYADTLKELKRLYENAIKPLEVLYKYRDLSNRHFGDAEIFSKPLILFMGPWSGGKSTIINYLTNNEYNETSLRTGAEPSPAYFNILMYGDEPEIIDGTELAADFTFSGLQKFGQGLEERLRGVKLPSKLLEMVNIVEIPGILEVRKQVSRLFPFNDACQWFIDRADIIFLVYDPSKLDVGPETEAILDQLKGREHQSRIILNKADQVKPEELLRVQGALIWNISPLMSSPQPPAMYTASLWSRPYENWAPVKLLHAQERAFLRDLRNAVDRRIENKISSARRFAVRVRNHAKMVDCYLTTYYNHKSVFGNRKQIANEIIDHPQDYHIYEGLSTLTNISRYDLPDPDVYRDFFKLNPLYEFQPLSATCTYFRGCPINRLDIAIAYDLPELVGTYKRNLEEAIQNAQNPPKKTSSSSESPLMQSKKEKKTIPSGGGS